MAAKRIAILRVSTELLRDLLLLPPGVEIIYARTGGAVHGEVELVVEGPGCPLTQDGCHLIEMKPEYSYDEKTDRPTVRGWH